MLNFESDYIQGAHPKILEKLIETNLEPLSGYGDDIYTQSAKTKIKALCDNEKVKVFLLTGGTQTNQIVIDTMISKFEGVVCADTGHINTHEAGAIEFTGHKVITICNNNGKISSSELKSYFENYYADENYEHTVIPGMVYISHPTEYGTLYTHKELSDISDICRQYNVPLYLDGARLGYALMSNGTDVSLKDIVDLCDVFYIGGTKVGALCGEAVVFTNNNVPKHFFTSVKQHGALLAKGRLTGIQFDVLFTDNLYFDISKHAIDMADKLRDILNQKGYVFYLDTITNQIFVVLDKDKYHELKSKIKMGYWETLDNGDIVVRFATSWATQYDDILNLSEIL